MSAEAFGEKDQPLTFLDPDEPVAESSAGTRDDRPVREVSSSDGAVTCL